MTKRKSKPTRNTDYQVMDGLNMPFEDAMKIFSQPIGGEKSDEVKPFIHPVFIKYALPLFKPKMLNIGMTESPEVEPRKLS